MFLKLSKSLKTRMCGWEGVHTFQRISLICAGSLSPFLKPKLHHWVCGYPLLRESSFPKVRQIGKSIFFLWLKIVCCSPKLSLCFQLCDLLIVWEKEIYVTNGLLKMCMLPLLSCYRQMLNKEGCFFIFFCSKIVLSIFNWRCRGILLFIMEEKVFYWHLRL